MTIQEFKQLPDELQLAYVYKHGNYLARRWDDFYQAVQLYQLPTGFFVELNDDVEKDQIDFLFAFEAGGEDDRLEDYAMFVKLPDWVPETE